MIQELKHSVLNHKKVKRKQIKTIMKSRKSMNANVCLCI